MGQVFSSHHVENIDDLVLAELQHLSNIWNGLWENFIDHSLIHLVSIVSVERWWDHDVDIWVSWQVVEDIAHLNVVVDKLSCVPLISFSVVSAEHDNDCIRL